MNSRQDQAIIEHARKVHGIHKQTVCDICGKGEMFKTDGDGRILCRRCANGTPATFRTIGMRVARNAPCPCGSGKKWKQCCMRKS